MASRPLIKPESLRFRTACSERLSELLQAQPGLSPLVAEMLVSRGYDTPEAVNRFFHPTPEALHDPYLLKGMTEAIEVLRQSLSNGEKILVQGDYDCDGICGAVLMMEALQEVGAQVSYHVPDRFTEGYGLSMKCVERCREEGVDLLITVDCGSSSVKEVAQARAYGIKVIVTDHHTVPPEPPEADAFLNPQQPDCPYPFKGICGTGVAFKLIQALRNQSGASPEHFLDLVALATVADVVPLVDENRVLVQYGLQELGRSRREGLTALLEVAGRSGRDVVDSFTVGFTLGPRLNAAGRLEHAKLGVELLLSRSLTESRQLAHRLDELNEARKECERAIQEEVETRLAKDSSRHNRGAIVEWGEGWHQGVIGITAGRLAEKYGVPTLIIATDGENAKGSGRSPENVDLYQALKQCGEFFTKYGGHPRAGGFSLQSDNLEPLAENFAKVCKELRTGPAPVWVDGCLTLDQASLDLVRELERMEPFGEKNPKPKFLLEGVDVVHQRLVGKSGDHLQLEIEQVGLRRRAIAFRQGEVAGTLKDQDFRYDLRCELGRDIFRGQEQLRLQVSGIVEPTCPDQLKESGASVVDLRHLRGRRQALSDWMGEHRFVAVCRSPVKAEAAYPSYSGRFFTYADRPSVQSGLIFLSPPDSVEAFCQFVERVKPPRMTILFGCAEIERALKVQQARRWDRAKAIKLWQALKRLGETDFGAEEIVEQAARLQIDAEAAMEIIDAFLETEAVVQVDSRFRFSQANGMKLEQTRAFCRGAVREGELKKVRAFFSGPCLAQRLVEKWTWLEPCDRDGAPQFVSGVGSQLETV